jgi:hypothetical protein
MPKRARTSIHPRSSMCGVLSVKERNDKLDEPHPVPTQDLLCPSVASAGRTEQAGTGAGVERGGFTRVPSDQGAGPWLERIGRPSRCVAARQRHRPGRTAVRLTVGPRRPIASHPLENGLGDCSRVSWPDCPARSTLALHTKKLRAVSSGCAMSAVAIRRRQRSMSTDPVQFNGAYRQGRTSFTMRRP